MKIRLRQLKNKNGTVSLRLDTFMGYFTDASGKRKAKRIRETLPFHIPTEETPNYTEEKLRLLQKADEIRKEKEIQLQESGRYPFSKEKTKNDFFIPFLEEIVSIKISNKRNNEAVWLGMQRWYKVFATPIIRFKTINDSHCSSFFNFLEKKAKKSNGTPLASSTNRLYFQKFYSVVQQAYLDGKIKELPAQPASFKRANKKFKTVLKRYEIIALRNAPYYNRDVKNAFILSIEMGLKLGQLRTLKWKDIHQEEDRWSIKMPNKGTNEPFNYMIPESIVSILGIPPKDSNNLVFPLLRSASEANVQLLKWVIMSGISRHITFESARNTFAFNKVSEGIAIQNVQRYLGHQNLRTTQKFIEQLQIDIPKDKKGFASNSPFAASKAKQRKHRISEHIRKELSAYTYKFSQTSNQTKNND